MTTKHFIKAILFSILIVSCTNKEEKFIIQGTVKGIEDNTPILLLNSGSITSSNIPVDSTTVVNEKFTFSGRVDQPKEFYIIIKSTMDFTSIWIENSMITFKAETKKFMDAKISGSKTQRIDDLLMDRLNPLYKAQEPIDKIAIERFDKYPDSIFNDSITLKQAEGEKKINACIREFIKDYPSNSLSASLLNVYKTNLEKEVVSELYALMNEETKNTVYGKSVNEYLNLNRGLKIGNRYIDFEQETPEGKRIKLSDHLGSKYTLIEFWASWCGSCIKSNPKLVEYYSKYKDKGFQIIGVSMDTNKESWIRAIDRDQLPWINMSDLDGNQNEAALIYNVYGLPNGILLNEEGAIIAIGLRHGTLKKKLEELFGY